jgi:hypothetical protein
MSITDELRKWAEEFWEFAYSKFGDKAELLAIADRIDADHQKAIRELNNFADASVLLPVDAEGEPIHIGDMMEHGKARGHVIALMLSEYPKKWGGELHWGVQLKGEQAPTALDLTFHHFHAPTVEDVLFEFALACEDAGNAGPEVERIAAEYAAKLRLVGDGE